MNDFCICEKANPLAVHGLFNSIGSAEKHLRETIPDYVRRGYFMDKTLTAESFTVRPYQYGKRRKG